jgi:addiction module HigA family antidote
VNTYEVHGAKTTTPGEILDEEFLKPMSLSQSGLAKHLGCDVKVINRIVNGRSVVTAEIAKTHCGLMRASGSALGLSIRQSDIRPTQSR